MAKKRRKPTEGDVLRIITIIADFVYDSREKMRNGELEWTHCIKMYQQDLGEFFFSMLKQKEVIIDVNRKIIYSGEMIDGVILKKNGLDVYIDC